MFWDWKKIKKARIITKWRKYFYHSSSQLFSILFIEWCSHVILRRMFWWIMIFIGWCGSTAALDFYTVTNCVKIPVLRMSTKHFPSTSLFFGFNMRLVFSWWWQLMSVEDVERILDETQEAIEYQRVKNHEAVGLFTFTFL